MNIRDLTEGQIKFLQGTCIKEFKDIPERVMVKESKEDVWKKAYSRGAQAILTMFDAKLNEGDKTKA